MILKINCKVKVPQSKSNVRRSIDGSNQITGPSVVLTKGKKHASLCVNSQLMLGFDSGRAGTERLRNRPNPEKGMVRSFFSFFLFPFLDLVS